MKELIQIIESLHNINKQMIEKDNFINNHSDVIELITQLIHDQEFVKSDIYLDLRVKYILPIEEKINRMKESQITIQPEFIPPPIVDANVHSKASEKKQINNVIIKAPIKTDIYMAPNNRPRFTKKKVTKNQDSQKKNIDIQLQEDDENQKKYFEFEHLEQTYYIQSNPLSDADVPLTFPIFSIVNGKLQIMGSLKGTSITLLNQNDNTQCENITLETVNYNEKIHGDKKILNNYFLM